MKKLLIAISLFIITLTACAQKPKKNFTYFSDSTEVVDKVNYQYFLYLEPSTIKFTDTVITFLNKKINKPVPFKVIGKSTVTVGADGQRILIINGECGDEAAWITVISVEKDMIYSIGLNWADLSIIYYIKQEKTL